MFQHHVGGDPSSQQPCGLPRRSLPVADMLGANVRYGTN
jgi:hypothetical protein